MNDPYKGVPSPDGPLKGAFALALNDEVADWAQEQARLAASCWKCLGYGRIGPRDMRGGGVCFECHGTGKRSA